MNGSANVNSIQALLDVKAALAVFVDQANGALEEVDQEIRRTLDWVLNEQPPYWQRQIRECEERVTQAKIDLHRCRSQRVSDDHVPDCAEQKAALRRAEQRLEEAREKLKIVREWGRQLPTLIDEYLAQAQQLGNYLVDDLGRASAALDGMTRALEGYLDVASPTGGASASVGQAAEAPESSSPQAASQGAGEESEDATSRKAAQPTPGEEGDHASHRS